MPGIIPTSEPTDVSGMCMGLGGPHAGSPGMPNKMGQQHKHSMMSQGMMGGPMPQGPPPPSMGGCNPNPNVNQPGGYSYVQVKPSAPNTIQYLPARPNVGHAPRGPPSLEFLQHYANPMPGMDAKMNSPSVNLQYFPNGCVSNSMGPEPVPQNQLVPMGGGGNGPPVMGNQQQGPPPMHPSMRQGVGGPPGPGMRQTNVMRMQNMVAGGSMVFPNSPMDPDKVFPPEMPGQTASPGMYPGPMGPMQKQPGLMSQMGPQPPEASQPLPPSMSTPGGNANFKNSPFMSGGPSMSDPNYAQQYHNFQQQLYATGTRGSGPQGHPTMHNQPNTHQQFFMPK